MSAPEMSAVWSNDRRPLADIDPDERTLFASRDLVFAKGKLEP